MNDFEAVKIEVYVPEEALGRVKTALHEAGAGRLGNYDSAAAEIRVKGYWRPLDGSNPYNGKLNEICCADEVKVEAYCRREYVAEVLKSIRQAHPYEEPVINVIPLVNHLFETR
ncbi:MAG: YqfO family protein [Candidatus Rifleibacteriota bacterium]